MLILTLSCCYENLVTMATEHTSVTPLRKGPYRSHPGVHTCYSIININISSCLTSKLVQFISKRKISMILYINIPPLSSESKNLATRIAVNSAIFFSLTRGQRKNIKRKQTSSLLRNSHSSVSSSAFYHLINGKTKMAPLKSLIFRRNDIAKDFRKARKDPVE